MRTLLSDQHLGGGEEKKSCCRRDFFVCFRLPRGGSAFSLLSPLSESITSFGLHVGPLLVDCCIGPFREDVWNVVVPSAMFHPMFQIFVRTFLRYRYLVREQPAFSRFWEKGDRAISIFCAYPFFARASLVSLLQCDYVIS